MTRSEIYLAKLMFQNKIFTSDGQAFENLFVRIQQNNDPDFKAVKPQGSYGDRKNDGFNKYTGEYFQVYGPEDLQLKENDANKKFENDFANLFEHWTAQGFTIKKFRFVINDKYHGAFPTLHVLAKKLADKYKIDCDIMTVKTLEETFLSLSDDKIIDIVGLIPDAAAIETFNYTVMHDVIQHLLKIDVPPIGEMIPDSVNFDRKISFNSLSRPVSEFLNAGRRQTFAIDDYFEFNSKFQKEELRQVFTSIYRESKSKLTNNDQIFQYIVDEASPDKSKAVRDSVYVLMAYYFEYCDIFETPE